ncbi:MAG: hypothetical protein NTX22_13785 [Ignavibacteriales bacterium]|nr:hypothetical protein [Ignavibacteriales bacterium]
MLGTIFHYDGSDFLVKKFLGKGKSGFSYLIENENARYVLKMIHDEDCPYYRFSDKMNSEIEAYDRLRHLNIPMPVLVFFDTKRKFIIKEFIDGLTGTEAIAKGLITDSIFLQLFKTYQRLKKYELNIDYFPSNFVIENEKLYYIDYEINPYLAEWDLINWGIYYWVNEPGMKKFIETGDASFINEFIDKGIPYKKLFQEKVDDLIEKFQ